MNARNRQKESTGLKGLLIALGVLAAAAVIVLGVFRIQSVEVVGTDLYSSEGVQNDLVHDFWSKNTLFLSWQYRSARYDSRMPYLSSVQVKMTGAASVTAFVEEKPVIGYVEKDGNCVCFDDEGKVLLISPEAASGAVKVTGITLDDAALYQRLPVDNTAILRTLLSITMLLRETELVPDEIRFDENQNIDLLYGDVTVEIGQDEYLEEKIANLAAIFPQIQNMSGKLNMTAFTGKNETITFKEIETEAETEAVTEPDNEESDGSGEIAAGDGSAETSETQADASAGEVAAGENGSDTSAENPEQGDDSASVEDTTVGVMVFDSSGTLRYDAHISGGQVVDSYGNAIDGCSVTEQGYIRDAYWNEIDPSTGQLMNG